MKKRILIGVLLASVIGTANADMYLDAAIGAHNGKYDSWVNRKWKSNQKEPIYNLLGSVELGYTWGNKSVFFQHISGTQQADTGLNMIGFKFRVF